MTEAANALTRRQVLGRGLRLGASVAGASFGLAAIHGAAFGARGAARLGTVLGPGRTRGENGAPTTYSFTLLDLDAADPRPANVPLSFFGHGLAIDPTEPTRAALFEKRGRGACVLDLGERRVVTPIETAPGREFYGHGAFSPDGSTLYATETDVEDGYRGVIVVRDGRTLEELGEFPSFGESPHDCVLRDGGKTLVVTNGGARVPGGDPPSVTYVDVERRELIERVEIENPEIGAGHLALTTDGDLAVVSAAREWMSVESLGGASFRPAGTGDERLHTVADPLPIVARMKGEALSLAIHEESGVVGITHPLASLVTFWSLRGGRLLRAMDLSFARGIALTLDRSQFVISYGKSTSLVRVSTDDLFPVPDTKHSSLAINGSHIVVHDLTT